jgi:hypothetical protein
MKAEELRTLADQATTERVRQTFRQLAETYGRLADDAERRADRNQPPRTG